MEYLILVLILVVFMFGVFIDYELGKIRENLHERGNNIEGALQDIHYILEEILEAIPEKEDRNS